MQTVKELTESSVTFEFKNKAGVAVTPPGTVSYYIQDIGTGTKIVPDTQLAVSGSSVDIVIAANDNRCLTDGSKSEERSLVITAAGFAKNHIRFSVTRID